jgi:integrase/recombinase XerD
MAGGLDIYAYERDITKCVESIRSCHNISDSNKIAIIQFHDFCFAEGLSPARVLKYLMTLKTLSGFLKKDFEKATKKDIQRIVMDIQKKDYSEWTKKDFKVTLKKFYKWLRGSEDYPEEVKWLKTSMKNGRTFYPEEVLSEQEIQRMIEAAEHVRDKALLASLYESGCRIGEILSLQVKHIEFTRFGARLIVKGKTGMRRVLLLSSVGYLTRWINSHPYRNDPESPLWLDIRKPDKSGKNKLMAYSNCVILLKRLAKRAKVNKRIYPHVFRHSRATFLANFMTEAQMKEMFGWKQGSDMPSVYVHLSGRDVDNALLKLAGIEVGEEKPGSSLKPKKCPRCSFINTPSAKICERCSLALDLQTAFKMEEDNKELNSLLLEAMDDPEIKRRMIRRLVEKGLGDKLLKLANSA